MLRTGNATKALVALTLALTFATTTAGSDPGADIEQAWLAAALQGDLTGAETMLADARTEPELRLQARFQARFLRVEPIEGVDDGPPPDDPFIAALIETYRDYWRLALLGRIDTDDQAAWLGQRIGALLVRYEDANAPPDDPFEAMDEAIARRGYHHIGGVTRPLFELMIWRTEERRAFDVPLTDRVQPVTVVFMDGFVSYGWTHYATFGRASAGGWAKPDALYCLKESYEIDSERFQVSYLRHEARHFADYGLYPKLAQADLEYRAKLTELAFAQASVTELIEKFAGAAAPNPDAPHSLANLAVIRTLEMRLGTLAGARAATVNPAAATLLAEHDARLVDAGAATTTGVIDTVLAEATGS
jgi:hypothetical protein